MRLRCRRDDRRDDPRRDEAPSWRPDEARRDDDERGGSRKRSLADRLVGPDAPSAPSTPSHDTPDSKRKKTERGEDRWRDAPPNAGRAERRGERERDRRRRRAGGDN